MRYDRSRHEEVRDGEERAKEDNDPQNSATARVHDDPKGDESSRLNASKEPGEDEEKQRVMEKLRGEREQDS